MNFQQLKHFVTAAHVGNLLRAAELLNISQSGLSRSISTLEGSIGMPLFERSARGVTLTAVGLKLLPRAKIMLKEQDRANADIRDLHDLNAGAATLGMNHSLAYYIAPSALAEIITRWPKVQLRVITANYLSLVEMLLDGEIDIGFSLYTEEGRCDELVYDHLHPFETRVFARLGHPVAEAAHVSPAELARHNWAMIEGGAGEEAFRQYFQSRGLPTPNLAVRCSSVALLVELAATTDLLTILPDAVDRSGKTRDRLQIVRTDAPFGSAHFGLIYRENSLQTPLFKRLVKSIRHHALSAAADRS